MKGRDLDYEALQKDFGIALTGGIACGKSTVADFIRKQNFVVLDADQLSRELTQIGSPVLELIVLTFGAEYLHNDGSFNRSKMRELIFKDPKQRLRLEAIIHPQLRKQACIHLEKKGLLSSPRIWFYEASLIFEKDLEKTFHQVWSAYCPLQIQINRLITRDQSTLEQAKLVIQSQMPASEKAKRADLVIDTNCTFDQLEAKVKDALASLG